mgnify:CR=1 FL=1
MSVNAAFRTVRAACRAVQAAVGSGARPAAAGRAVLGVAALGTIVGLSSFGAVAGSANAVDTPAALGHHAADAAPAPGSPAEAATAAGSPAETVPAGSPAEATTAAGSPVEAAGPTDPVVASVTAVALPDAAKIPSYEGALQPNAYYCGPAATRIALTAHGYAPSFDDLARALGTTPAGTASIFEVTRVLNEVHGYERYESVELSHRGATGAQVKKLREDVKKAINEGDPVVANIIGTITDTAGEVHSYNGGHYVTITGYSDGGEIFTVTDPADRVGSNEYQVPLRVMADWISSRGYTA